MPGVLDALQWRQFLDRGHLYLQFTIRFDTCLRRELDIRVFHRVFVLFVSSC